MHVSGTWRRVVPVVAAMALALVVVGLLEGGRGARAQDGTTVTIADFTFSPNSITVQAGSTVTWVNNDTVPHTATGNNGEFDTGQIAPGGSASITFDNAGTFAYFCSIHPNMTATIIVQAATDETDQTEQLPDTGAGVATETSSLVAYAALASLFFAIGGLVVRRRMA